MGLSRLEAYVSMNDRLPGELAVPVDGQVTGDQPDGALVGVEQLPVGQQPSVLRVPVVAGADRDCADCRTCVRCS